MCRTKYSKVLLALVLLCSSVCLSAQSGAYTGYTPYSIYGIGEIYKNGSAYNKSMGGVGVATRNRKYINYLNPASVTARDSLSFMADASYSFNTIIYQNGDAVSAHNIYTINDFAISFPIYRSSAVIFGITPYSSTGYAFSSYDDDYNKIADTGGRIKSSVAGQGGLYELFAGGAVIFWKKLSLGAEWLYYFGNTSKESAIIFSNSTYNGLTTGYSLNLSGSTAKLGVQYEQPLGKYTLGAGATYKFKTKLNGYVGEYSLTTGTVTDTLAYKVDTLGYKGTPSLSLASEIAVGISLRYREKWRVEFDYTYADWRNAGFDNVKGYSTYSASTAFSTTIAESYRLGFEYTPNINDIRYYRKRCTYRAGLFRESEYFALDGAKVYSTGLSLGVTLPVFKGSNGLTFTAELGQTGNLSVPNLTRQRFVNFCFGFNAYDLWFMKHQYR